MTEKTTTSFLQRWRGALITLPIIVLLPFVIGLLEGESPAAVLSNSAGTSKFVQGLAIEVFILALYALSYDLIFGITGLLSFGHSMFFAVGAYLTGALLKSFGLSLWETLIMVGISGLVGGLLGVPLGVFLRLTDDGGVLENGPVNKLVGWLVNAVRSTPFIILLVAISRSRGSSPARPSAQPPPWCR